MATLNLGRIKPVFRGAYAGGTAYVVDDIVTSGNETFICIQASTGNATSNASYWTKLAAKGTDGTDLGTTLTTQGDILYRDGSGLQRLAKPASDKILQNTSGGVVSWIDAPSGKVKQIVTATASGATANSNTTSGYAGGALGNVGTTHISANITPTSSSSKLIIQASALCGVGGNGTGLVAVFVDNVAQGAVSVAGYGSDASNGTVSCFVANSSTSQRTVEYRTCGEWSGSATTLGHMRNGSTLSTNSHYGTLVIMEVE